MNLAKIYPYVVPAGYLNDDSGDPDEFILPLGHDLFTMLVHDLDGLCRNVFLEELIEAGHTPAAAHQRAIENLEALAKGQDIRRSMHRASNGTPFILWSGHWLTASCIRLPGLHKFASKLLKVEMVCVSIPQREAMVLFPSGTAEERDQMRALIRENESDAPKQLTWELFTLSSTGLQPFIEQ